MIKYRHSCCFLFKINFCYGLCLPVRSLGRQCDVAVIAETELPVDVCDVKVKVRAETTASQDCDDVSKQVLYTGVHRVYSQLSCFLMLL